jgi:hypothetical protein
MFVNIASRGAIRRDFERTTEQAFRDRHSLIERHQCALLQTTVRVAAPRAAITETGARITGQNSACRVRFGLHSGPLLSEFWRIALFKDYAKRHCSRWILP